MGKFKAKTQECIKIVTELYNSGINVSETARKTNLDKATVKKILVNSGITIRPRPTLKLFDQRFGRLKVIDRIYDKKPEHTCGNVYWKCLCDCGNFIDVAGPQLKSGDVKSCGCLFIENAKKNGKRVRNRQTHKYEEISAATFGRIKRCAKTRGLAHEVSREYLWNLYLSQKKKCALSGIFLKFARNAANVKNGETASLDRVDSSKGYVEGNVQWVHKDINSMKWDFTQDEFIEYCRKISQNRIEGKGILYGTRVYLAGNIENSNDFKSWRDIIAVRLKKLGIVSLDPTKEVFIKSFKEDIDYRNQLLKMREEGRFDELTEIMKKIVGKDLRMVDISDFTIFYIEPDCPTYGTTHELVNAAMDRKPILMVISDKRKLPLWYFRYVKAEHLFESIEELYDYIAAINDGSTKINENEWKILDKKYLTP